MPQDTERDTSYTQNRELSWLRFNLRVLEEANDPQVPLLERLKFVSIFTSNLDEFFMIRVGSLFDLSIISPKDFDNKTGLTPIEQLHRIYAEIPQLIETRDKLYGQVMGALSECGIRDLQPEELSAPEKKYLSQYFKASVLPILSPQIVDSRHPFPHLLSKQLYIASHMHEKKGGVSLGLIPVPDTLPPFIQMPDDPCRFVRTENLILSRAASLYGNYKPEENGILCVTRNADISFDEDKFEDIESIDYRSHVSKLLKKRSRLGIVRLELQGQISPEFQQLLSERISVENHQIYFARAPLCMKYIFDLTSALPEEIAAPLLFDPYTPRQPMGISPNHSMIDQIRRHDRLLFFPFDSVDPFLRLLSEAAERDDVISIRITIYRLASSSKIAHILCRAAENGKEVTVLMELRARFDEANNISWSRLLEDSGCRVIYGVEDFKCHSKLCLITMRRGESIEYITQVGTGNYNEKTNTMYTDLSFMTARREIGEDATAFFRNMLVANLEGEYGTLLVSPLGIKAKLIELMDEEIAKGSEGYICIKANSMTEREVIDKLAECSQAGVQVQLILRSICCLLPGIFGKTENIHVTSIVGRYLEHSRIYCFGRGDGAKLFISSADLMTRNLVRRVEVACPIEDEQLRKYLLWILTTQLSDNIKASTMSRDGTYQRKYNSKPKLNSQRYFMENFFPFKKEEPVPWWRSIIDRLFKKDKG
ncbi:MAG: polyphosphate kinase 1 [Oscillospiraceae bacterium]